VGQGSRAVLVASPHERDGRDERDERDGRDERDERDGRDGRDEQVCIRDRARSCP